MKGVIYVSTKAGITINVITPWNDTLTFNQNEDVVVNQNSSLSVTIQE